MLMGVGLKSKRKDIDQVNDDFSDFSLSSPATKIRRLDTELPPIVEGDDEEPNQERAIVLFNPPQPFLPNNNNNLSLSLNPDLISGFKNQLVRESQIKSGNFEGTESDKQRQMEMGRCLAVIPWVPSHIPSINENASVDCEEEIPESMEADEMDVEEENNSNSGNGSAYEYGLGGFHNWPQQQHCMIPQPPQNPYTSPIAWS